METLVTAKAVETTEEIVCKISKIKKCFQSDFSCFIKAAEMTMHLCFCL